METQKVSQITPTATPAAHQQNKTDVNSKKDVLKIQPPVFFQPKLTIGTPNDVYEKEADAMADKVMRMQMPETVNFSSSKNAVNRKCTECEEEKKLHRKESGSDLTSVAPPIVSHVINSSSGKSMDSASQSFMESRFNYDFSNVKIHDHDLAAKSASSINALAYTSGNNIVFNSGQYNPNSDSGKRLLAHELTHVVQQGRERNSIQKMAINQVSLVPRTCGGRSVKWSFTLSSPATADGYFVQEINVYEIKSSGCPAISGPPAPIQTFWEAFPVATASRTHGLHSTLGYSDESGYPSNPNSNGTSQSAGKVKFFLKSVTGDLGGFSTSPSTANGWGPGMVPRSGIVPSTASQPTWWTTAPTEGPENRSATSVWDCCSSPGFNNISATP